MKRTYLLPAALAACFSLSPSLAAQRTLGESVARKEIRDNFTRMNSRISELEETLLVHNKRMAKLEMTLSRLSEEILHLKNRDRSSATRDSINRLASQIKEVDRKRLSDHKLVMDQFRTMKVLIQGSTTSSTRTTKPPPPESGGGGSSPPEGSYTYEIKPGDTLVRLVKDLREEGYKITQKQVEKANPGVKWTRLQVGQKIIIPPESK